MAEGRLVYFHNHGNPGAGIYPPTSWVQHKAVFSDKGTPIPDAAWADSLVPLKPDGMYRVERAFTCCEKKCQVYEPDMLVMLSYDAHAEPFVVVPVWTATGFTLPANARKVSRESLQQLAGLKLSGTAVGAEAVIH